MLLYKYQATDIAGNPRSDVIEAEDEASANKVLKSLGLTEITLAEIEPPPPPMSPTKRGLYVVGFILVILALLFAADRFCFGPPDTVEYFINQDRASEQGDAEVRFGDYADYVLVANPSGKQEIVAKSQLISKFRSDTTGVGDKVNIVQESAIRKEFWADDQFVVVVEHRRNFAFVGSLQVTSTRKIATYVWHRKNLKWQIVAEVINSSDEGNRQ